MEGFPHISFKKDWELSSNSIFYLGQIQSIIKAISYAPLMPNYHKILLGISLKKGAQATTSIEGNTLSDEEINKIYKGESLPPSKEYQEIEVKNIINAFNFILDEIVKNEKSDLISPDLIKNFHRRVGENLGDHFQAIPGQFRLNNVLVGPYRPPDYKYVPELINKLCGFLKNDEIVIFPEIALSNKEISVGFNQCPNCRSGMMYVMNVNNRQLNNDNRFSIKCMHKKQSDIKCSENLREVYG